jgi:flavin-dependent dehydrogenase
MNFWESSTFCESSNSDKSTTSPNSTLRFKATHFNEPLSLKYSNPLGQTLKRPGEVDVIVVGGSLSGLVLAHLLGMEGSTVAVIDPENPSDLGNAAPREMMPLTSDSAVQATAPTHFSSERSSSAHYSRMHSLNAKPCGEGMSAIGMSLLRTLVPTEELFIDKWSYPLFGYRFYDDKRELRNRVPLVFGVQRAMCKRALARVVFSYSNSISIQGMVIKATTDPQGCAVQYSQSVSPSNASAQVIRSKVLVVADGAYSRTLRQFSSTRIKSGAPRFGVRFHVHSGSSDDLVTVCADLANDVRINVLLTPIDNNIINVSLLMPQVTKGKDVALSAAKRVLIRIYSKLPEFLSPPQGRVITSSRSHYYEPRLFAVGDAWEQLDPRGGMGMTHAIISARHAAQVILEFLSGSNSISQSLRQYRDMMEREGAYLRGITQLSSLGLSSWGDSLIGGHIRSSRLSSEILSYLKTSTRGKPLAVLKHGLSFLGRHVESKLSESSLVF